MLELWRSFSFWSMLPLRVFLWSCSFMFGHPLSFLAGFVVVGALASVGGLWSLLGGCAAMVGLLLMWIAEFPGTLNTAWPARSPLLPALPKEA